MKIGETDQIKARNQTISYLVVIQVVVKPGKMFDLYAGCREPFATMNGIDNDES